MVQDPVEKAITFVSGLRNKYFPMSLKMAHDGGLMDAFDHHAYEACLSVGIG